MRFLSVVRSGLNFRINDHLSLFEVLGLPNSRRLQQQKGQANSPGVVKVLEFCRGLLAYFTLRLPDWSSNDKTTCLICDWQNPLCYIMRVWCSIVKSCYYYRDFWIKDWYFSHNVKRRLLWKLDVMPCRIQSIHLSAYPETQDLNH